MSKSTKDKVLAQIKTMERELEIEKKAKGEEENRRHLREVEKSMQINLARLQEVSKMDINQLIGFHLEINRLKELGFIVTSDAVIVPRYEGGKFSQAQLLARKYNAKLRKARKERNGFLKDICNQIMNQLATGQFYNCEDSLSSKEIRVVVYLLDYRNWNEYDYDIHFVKDFLAKRNLELDKIWLNGLQVFIKISRP